MRFGLLLLTFVLLRNCAYASSGFIAQDETDLPAQNQKLSLLNIGEDKLPIAASIEVDITYSFFEPKYSIDGVRSIYFLLNASPIKALDWNDFRCSSGNFLLKKIIVPSETTALLPGFMVESNYRRSPIWQHYISSAISLPLFKDNLVLEKIHFAFSEAFTCEFSPFYQPLKRALNVDSF